MKNQVVVKSIPPKYKETIDLNLKFLQNHDLREHRILPALNYKELAGGEWVFIYELLKPFPQCMSQDALVSSDQRSLFFLEALLFSSIFSWRYQTWEYDKGNLEVFDWATIAMTPKTSTMLKKMQPVAVGNEPLECSSLKVSLFNKLSCP